MQLLGSYATGPVKVVSLSCRRVLIEPFEPCWQGQLAAAAGSVKEKRLAPPCFRHPTVVGCTEEGFDLNSGCAFRHLGKEACAENCGCRQLRLRLQDGSSSGSSRHLEVTKGSDEGSWEQSCAFSALFCIQLRLLASGSWAKPQADCAVGALCKGKLGGLQVLLPFKCPSCPSSQPLRRCCGWARMNSAKEAHRKCAASLRLLAFRHMRHRLL